MSLKRTTYFIILLLFALLGLITIFLGMFLFINTMDKNMRSLAKKIAVTATENLDADKLEGYLDNLVKDDDYNQMLQKLSKIKGNNKVTYLSVIQVTEDGLYIIFDTNEEGSPSSLIESHRILQIIKSYMEHETEEFPTLVTQGSFGWLCSAYEPIKNKQGEIIAVTSVGIQLDTTIKNRAAFLVTMITSMWFTAITLTAIIIFLLRKNIIKPIKELAYATGDFVTNNTDGIKDEKNDIENLRFRYGNEIDQLTDTIFTMEKIVLKYMDKLSKVTMQRDNISAELSIAASIQKDILPSIFQIFPFRNEFALHASLHPTKEVGGDFYDAYMLDEERLGFVVADVSGNGVSTALFKIIINALIKTQANLCSSPAEILTNINRLLYENNKVRMFAAAFMGILDLKTGTLTYANAGHIQPLFSERGKYYQYISSKPGFILAGLDGIQYKDFQLQIEPGDRLFLYTDGLLRLRIYHKSHMVMIDY
jgi:sigma-B regulation protein RsbU (phosphoserine phosphatase)